MLRLENPEARFILAGDLNMEIGADGYGEPPIMADDPRALLRVLPIPGTRPERGPFDGATEDVVHRESGHGDGNANHGAVLHSPWDGLGEGSYVFRGEPRAVDHLLFSPAFFHGSEGLRYESTRLVREWADGSGAPRRYESFRQAGVTDHFALVARLSTRRSAGPGEGG
jgi:hypothetical protein